MTKVRKRARPQGRKDGGNWAGIRLDCGVSRVVVSGRKGELESWTSQDTVETAAAQWHAHKIKLAMTE